MKFGLRYCNTGRYVDGRLAVELVQAAEEAGFESAWTVEHTVVPEGYESAYPYSADGKMAGGAHDFPLPDPLVWMAYVGGQTSRIKLGTGILILPQHSPVITAKQVATLDRMTGGRVLLGIGVGWLREEFEVIGAPFDDRAARTDEYVAAMRALWDSNALPSPESSYSSTVPIAGRSPWMGMYRSSSAVIRRRRRGGRDASATGSFRLAVHRRN